MSKIALSPNASGSGTFTLASPNSNTSRTITLPDADVTLGPATPSISDNGSAVGIGTSSAASYYANRLVVDTGSSVQSGVTIVSETSKQGMFAFADGTSGDQRYRGYINYHHNTDTMTIGAVGGAVELRITASGNLLMGTNSSSFGQDGFQYLATKVLNLSRASANCMNLNRNGSNGQIVKFHKAGQAVGDITVNGSATAYGTSSDYRLKENVDYDWDATTRLKQLKPARFNFIADADTTVDGFLAHEAQAVVPECATGTHNGTETLTKVVLSSSNTVLAEDIEQSDYTAGKLATTDEDENEVAAISPADSTWAAEHVAAKMQSIDQAKLVPLLVKTILELEARITALES